MRVAQMTRYGSPELLTVTEVADPLAGPGEVAVNILTAAVNYPDLLIMSGGYQASWPLPLIPGSEFAGTVASTGPGVSTLAPGDRVAGTVAVGAFAEKIAVCRARGAEAVIDYTGEDLKTAIKRITGRGADVVLDPVGGPYSEQALRATAWGGQFVCLGFASGEIPRIPLNLALLKGVVIRGFEIRTFGENRPDLATRDEAELAAHFAAGRLRPCISARYELADIASALWAVLNRKTYGKVVIMMSDPANWEA